MPSGYKISNKRRFIHLGMGISRSLTSLFVSVPLVWACLWFAPATAAKVTVEAEQPYLLGSNTYIFSEKNLDWKTVANKPLEEGRKNESPLFNLEGLELPIWARMEITVGDISEGNQWLLNTNNNFGGKLTLYVVANGRLLESHSVNSYESFDSRPYDFRQLVFPLDLEPNTSIKLLIRFDEVRTAFFAPTLLTEELLLAPERRGSWLQGIQLGVLVGLMLYHFMLAGATFDKAYLYYSLYIAANGMFNLTQTGYGYQHLWPNMPALAIYLEPMSYYLPTFTGILFTVNFLRLRKLSKGFTYFFYGAFALIAALLALRYSGFQVFALDITWVTIIVFPAFIVAGVYALRRGVVYARYFLIAWTLYCVALVNWMLGLLGLPVLFPEYSYNMLALSFDIQLILLALALAHRIRTLRDSKLEAEADNRAKSSFLARMSHEIRTPLSGVLGMSELLSDRLKDKTNIYYNNIIRSSGTSLLTIINDILDYSKFTSGKMELEDIPFSIQKLAVDSLDIFKVRAGEKNVELIADIDFDLPPFVQGDPTRVKQVMLNLVSNAVKFTQEGQIVLSVKLLDGERGMVKIAVTDSGEGIPEQERAQLFESFSQANTSTAREHGGTGLGLSISKQLASLMGGEIGVESTVGEGSTFWFTAHLPESEYSEQAVDIDAVSLKGYKLLIVEDNYTFADLIQTQASLWEMDTTVAHDGQEALEILKSAYENGETFDLISLDLRMPHMDGLEFSRTIQLDYRFNKIPRLLLTSATNYPSRASLKQAGIDKVMEKPTLPAELLHAYKELLAGDAPPAQQSSLAREERPPVPAMNILVVEDNSVNQVVIRGILERFNQIVEIVDDGEDAVEQLTSNEAKYDLVLMDCEMQRMDGITATKHIRQWEEQQDTPATPIVALTAHAVQSQIQACEEAGMDNYLTKPLEIDKLEKLLRHYAPDLKNDSNGESAVNCSG